MVIRFRLRVMGFRFYIKSDMSTINSAIQKICTYLINHESIYEKMPR